MSTIVLALEPGFELTIPKVANSPKIDGVLNDSIWSGIPSVKINNINEGGVVDAARVSTAMAAYDDTYLYVAIDNGEPNPKQITTVSPGHDQDVWMDDENELFIDPQADGAKPYYHIMINAANVVQDDESGGAEGAWESTVESATKVGTNNWMLEARIPLKTLGVTGRLTGQAWGWNFNRHIVSGVDIWTGWSTTGPSFHTPNRFGKLTFGEAITAVDAKGKLSITWGRLKAQP
jgi:hypothetical protein